MWNVFTDFIYEINPILWISAIIGAIWSIIKYHQFEHIREETESKLKKLQQTLDDKSHSSQKQFDLKIEVYEKLFDLLINAVDRSSLLLPIFDQLPEKIDEQKRLW